MNPILTPAAARFMRMMILADGKPRMLLGVLDRMDREPDDA